MVATYTNNARLTKQGTNDNPNTWGSVLNDQVIELIEELVCGVINVDITGSSNVTLSTNNGATDQGRHATLELTGTLGANIDLILPAIEKQYFIRGNWVGAFTVTVKISGSSTELELESGDKKIVYINGTDIYDMVDVDISNLLVNSNNLSDLTDAADARDNLGLGDIAVYDVGTGLSVSGSNLNVGLLGEIKMWPTASAPSGWLNCDGSAVSRTTYANLFALLGTTFGSGDGSTTFNVPDFKGRSPIGIGQGTTGEGDVTGTSRSINDKGGYETHTLTEDEMPSHIHNYDFQVTTATNGPAGVRSSLTSSGITVDETLSAGGDDPHNNMHPYIGINFIIFSGV